MKFLSLARLVRLRYGYVRYKSYLNRSVKYFPIFISTIFSKIRMIINKKSEKSQ